MKTRWLLSESFLIDKKERLNIWSRVRLSDLRFYSFFFSTFIDIILRTANCKPETIIL